MGWSSIIWAGGGFVGGALIEGCVGFVRDLLTDRRRRAEERTGAKHEFERIREMMPELIAEMAQDMRDHPVWRECIAEKQGSVWIQGKVEYFFYETARHAEVHRKMQVLTNAGYLEDKSHGSVHHYMMLEPFVKLLQSC